MFCPKQTPASWVKRSPAAAIFEANWGTFDQSGVRTCGVGLAVVLAAVLHLDGRQAERLDHLVGPLAPVRRAEGRHGQAEGQRGQRQRQQGPLPAGHLFQHGRRRRSLFPARGAEAQRCGGMAGARRGERGRRPQIQRREIRGNRDRAGGGIQRCARHIPHASATRWRKVRATWRFHNL